ncbi:glycosyltransferase family 2 protein [Candidatus Sumerlaeota bacterium]|nr:glycosyltransferase family 2 protein [Candidatus Sumerlaeota bacterium]
MPYDLAVVIPAYNEEACIARVVESWRDVLSGLDIQFRIVVLNDGSRDGTAQALEVFRDDDRIEVANKANSGHGPTILVGYGMACAMADWVFQCDGDDEIKAVHFHEFWKRRDDYDALLGVRVGRVQNAGRRFISAVSRLAVRVLFGRGVGDVNVPYRLIRAGLLKEIVASIPPDTFAPNVIVSGALARARARILNLPVPHEGRTTGSVSIVRWRLWKSAARALWQTIRCRPRVGGGPGA